MANIQFGLVAAPSVPTLGGFRCFPNAIFFAALRWLARFSLE
jgi:hypothetical protein